MDSNEESEEEEELQKKRKKKWVKDLIQIEDSRKPKLDNNLFHCQEQEKSLAYNL